MVGAGAGVVTDGGGACSALVDGAVRSLPVRARRRGDGRGVVDGDATAVAAGVSMEVAAGIIAAASVPRANSACALISTSLIARAPSPSAGTFDPFTETCNLSGRPTLIIGRLASAGTS